MADRTPRSIQNPESVRRALREFDKAGREAFLAKYGVGSARKFELVEDGHVYDAKAVLAAAFAYEFPDEPPLATTEFDGNDATVRGHLERLGFQVSARASGDEGLRADLEQFRESAPGRLWLRVRRQRAAVLRDLLAEPGSVTLDMFNREVWPLESASVLRGEPVKLAAGGGEIRWESSKATDLLGALDAGELELHGNYMWGSGTHVYGAMLQADAAEKTRNLQLAAEILNRSDIGPDVKASQLELIDGFGPNVSTGLVMAFHPTEFAIYNQPSRAIVKDMGYLTDTVEQFERSAATLREKIGAEDFLELDLFLYVRQKQAKRPRTAMPVPPDSGAPVSFSAADCALFERFHNNVPTGEATEGERAHLKDLRARLKAMALQVGQRLGQEGLVPEASLWNVQGHIGPDLWCCVYPASAGHKSFALQIAFIVSPRGGELCFCLGSGKAKAAEAKVWAVSFDRVRSRLFGLPADIRTATQTKLGSKYMFRKSWRLEPGSADYASFDDWIYAASRSNQLGASISRYLSRPELETRGEQIVDDMVELGRAVLPMLEFAYSDKPHVDPDLPKAEGATKEPPEAELEYTREWLASRTLWPEAELDAIIDTVNGSSPQIVLAGPPGTGKTWVAKQLVTYLTQGRPDCQRLVQFHPSYGYEDFLEGLRPVTKGGGMTFEPVNGIVLDIVAKIGDRKTPFYLIVDEMNRANLSRVFGELMYLFEYRDEAMSLRYTPEFELPRTLRFIGTMNTADRSIRSIDIALRRRFEVFECPPSLPILKAYYDEPGHTNEVDSLFSGFELLNQKLTERIDRHHAIGHTFFMAPTMTVTRLTGIWSRKVRPLLEEYFFDQPEMVAEEFRPESFWPELSAS